MTDWKAADGREALRVAFKVFGSRAPLEVEDLRAAIEAESTGRLIVDPNTWGRGGRGSQWAAVGDLLSVHADAEVSGHPAVWSGDAAMAGAGRSYS